MKIGTKVQWTSHGQGTVSTKEGKLVAVVPAGTSASEILTKRFKVNKYDLSCFSDVKTPRSTKSYIVVANRGETRKPRIYWPRVNHIKAAPQATA